MGERCLLQGAGVLARGFADLFFRRAAFVYSFRKSNDEKEKIL